MQQMPTLDIFRILLANTWNMMQIYDENAINHVTVWELIDMSSEGGRYREGRVSGLGYNKTNLE